MENMTSHALHPESITRTGGGRSAAVIVAALLVVSLLQVPAAGPRLGWWRGPGSPSASA